MSANNDFAQNLAEAIKHHKPLPAFEQELDLDRAYALQHNVTAHRSAGAVGGIKAGVTARAVQEFLGLESALIASLYEDSRFGKDCTLPYLAGRGVESELAIQVDNEGKPIAIAPAIEIVYVNFSRDTDFNAANLVACNLGADLYIVGDFQPWSVAWNDLSMTLTRDGEVLNTTSLNEALGDPNAAAHWMIQEAQQRGFPRESETLLLAGACGAVVPGEPGHYQANYGELGSLAFTIAP